MHFSATRRLKPSRPTITVTEPLEKAKKVEPAPIEERSPLGAKLAGKSVVGHKFVVSVEMNPPKGHDVSRVLEAADRLRFHGVDVVNVPDGPRASARMGGVKERVCGA
jgi:homocysteine S-methyltransferase